MKPELQKQLTTVKLGLPESENVIEGGGQKKQVHAKLARQREQETAEDSEVRSEVSNGAQRPLDEVT